MTKEHQDALAAGALIVAVFVGWYFFVHKPSSPSTTSNSSESEPVNSLSTSSVPSYNIPPTLVLPPFNTGNTVAGMPTHTDTSSSEHGGCGCNACGTGGNNYFSEFLKAFDSNNEGIVAPANTAASSDTFKLSTPTPITAPVLNVPYANSYAQWAVKEGFQQPNNAMTGTTSQRDMIPGSQNWTGAQIYKAYQLLKGGLFGNANPYWQQQLLDQVNAMT